MTVIPDIRHQRIREYKFNAKPYWAQSLFYIKTKSNMPNFSKATCCTKWKIMYV